MDRIYEGWKRFSEAFPRDSLDGTWAIDWEYFGDFFFWDPWLEGFWFFLLALIWRFNKQHHSLIMKASGMLSDTNGALPFMEQLSGFSRIFGILPSTSWLILGRNQRNQSHRNTSWHWFRCRRGSLGSIWSGGGSAISGALPATPPTHSTIPFPIGWFVSRGGTRKDGWLESINNNTINAHMCRFNINEVELYLRRAGRCLCASRHRRRGRRGRRTALCTTDRRWPIGRQERPPTWCPLPHSKTLTKRKELNPVKSCDPQHRIRVRWSLMP